MLSMLFHVFFACSASKPDTGSDGVQTTDVVHGVYTDQGSYFVGYTNNPDPIPFNEYFAVEVSVYSDETAAEKQTDIEVFVDAIMPAHGHGMAETPTITRLDNGNFLADGLKWQMTGTWELQVYITKETTEIASWEIECCL
jgi:hypothetical protein